MSDENVYVESDQDAPTRVREGYMREEAGQEIANEASGEPDSYVESEAEAPARVREGYMREEIEDE